MVVALLAFDLCVLHRRPHPIQAREAAASTVGWIGLALLFALALERVLGAPTALDFLTAYVIEKALSLDNLFAFLLLFSYFAVPAALQHRVLFWGIFGALALRGAFVLLGSAVLHAFHPIVYLLGAGLVVAGVRAAAGASDGKGPVQGNRAVGLLRRLIPISDDYGDGRFIVRVDGRRMASPLLVALVTIELTDVAFAIDSVPAVLAITSDPFVAFTSNVLAILGLRSLYFLLSAMLRRLRYLRFGLGAILAFVGAKLLLAPVMRMSSGASLAVIAALLVATVSASLVADRAGP
jgi:tellurite resistance protein TerC